MVNECKQALRRLGASPVTSCVSVVCLSIGVWMACIVSAVVGGAFRPQLHFEAPERVVFINEAGLFSMAWEDRSSFFPRVTSKAVIDSLAAHHVFAAIGHYERPIVSQVLPAPDYYWAVRMSSGMMSVLGVQ